MNRLLTSLRHLFFVPPAEPIDLTRHRPALDGVRGLAVLLVLCYDCLKIAASSDPVTLLVRRGASAGWIGVDLFFVLSGFLITGILLETRGKPGYWKNFIARRSLRIFPLYYATLFVVFVTLPAFFWLTGISSSTAQAIEAVRADQVWYWLYLQNWLFAWRQAWPADGILKHFWSLAIEEQFYLVWPLIVALLPKRPLSWLCLSICVLAMCLRFQLMADGLPGMVGFVMTISRMDSLCWGALLAIGLRSYRFRQQLVQFGPALAALGVSTIVLGDLTVGLCRSESYLAYTGGHTVIAICFVGLIAGAVAAPETHPLTQCFSNIALVTLGKYSYAIYVFHKFIFYGVRDLNWSLLPAGLQGWAIFLTTCGLSLLAARLSWVLLEQPFLRLKRYFPTASSSASENERSINTSSALPSTSPSI